MQNSQDFQIIVDGVEIRVKFKPFAFPTMHQFEFMGGTISQSGYRNWFEPSSSVTDPKNFARAKVEQFLSEQKVKNMAYVTSDSQRRLEILIGQFAFAPRQEILNIFLTSSETPLDISEAEEKIRQPFIKWLRLEYEQKPLESGIQWQILLRRWIYKDSWESEEPDWKRAAVVQLQNNQKLLIEEIDKFQHPQLKKDPALRLAWIDWVKTSGDNSEHPALSWEKFNSWQDTPTNSFIKCITAIGEAVAKFTGHYKQSGQVITTFTNSRLFEYNGYVLDAHRVFLPQGEHCHKGYAFNRIGEFNGIFAKADTLEGCTSALREKIDSGYQNPLYKKPLLFPGQVEEWGVMPPDLQKFHQACKRSPDTIFFVREKDLYNTYFEQAFIVSSVTNMLSNRYYLENIGKYVVTAGVVVDSVSKIKAQLVEMGFKVELI